MSETTDNSGITDCYDLAALNTALAGTIYAGNLHYEAVTHSTNSLALAAAQNNAPAGTVYFTDEQTAGRGRGTHQWHSPAGVGLYVSVLFRPKFNAARALFFSLAAGLAAKSAIHETTGCEIDIRWPNDLMLNNKKCGGILVESATEPTGQLRHAVIGIGINVRHTSLPPELAAIATSLAISSGHQHSRQPLLIALLRALAAEITALENSSTANDILQRFTAASTWANGKAVHVGEAGGYTGITAGLSPQGLLLVQTATGLRTVTTGGVRAL